MIKTLYYCDKCGSFIPDDFAQVFVEGLCQRERKLDVLDKVYEQVMDKHFCPDCAEKIVDFCLTPIKIEPKEEKKDDAPAPLPKKKALDIGKIWALHDAGWKTSDIAKELGCTGQAIRNHLKEGRPAGMEKPDRTVREHEFTRIEEWS